LDLVADKEGNGQNGVDWADTSKTKVLGISIVIAFNKGVLIGF
jgi:hypothetical protein